MGMKMKKFSLLMWKNWILQIRHPIQTLFEILVPVFFCAVLVLVRSLVESTEQKEIIYKPYNQSDYLLLFYNNFTEIAYSPDNPTIEKIIDKAIPTIPTLNIIKNKFNDSKTLESYLISKNNDGDKIGIVFPDNFKNITEFPPKIDFTLRFPAETNMTGFTIENWRTNLLFPLVLLAGPRERSKPFTASPPYFLRCFLLLQEQLSREIINEVTKTTNNKLNILMSRYPYPAYMDDPLLSVIQKMIGLIIVLAFVYSSISIIKVITAEKEKQLKESMKIMGLPSWLHWTAWFVKSLTFLLISIIIMVALLKIDFWYEEGTLAVFPKSDTILLFLFLLLYICSIITLCFGISVFFTKANMAAGIGGVTFFLFLVPYTLLQNRYQDLSLAEKLLACLMSNSAMGYGFQLICMFESTGEGLQWGNMWRTVTPDDNLLMGHVFIMLLLDTILYILIALYVEAVYPGKYGVPKKWNFIFTWCFSDKTKVQGIETLENSIEHDPQTYEAEPINLRAGIEIRHLGKTYANKEAVKDLSLNMFEDQITVLLGHNGAGKTTTMSMLTGIFPPTSGTAIINGYDISNDISNVRSSLGLCPQHNILFDELTVSEHIYFYSCLKGMEKNEVKNEIETYLKLLEFEDKRNKRSCTLSGGMKRKLSVAVAFCGNSKVVMLDEPTAGMDPAARRALWELVNSQKKGRTIMLTTHFMDEADLLGDRIAIMAGGVLQCCGSSFFLKKKYGAGYHLIMEKSNTCDVNSVTELLQTHIPHIKVQSNIGTELTYLLNEEDSSVFQDMLKDIEKRSEELGIKSYGISLTTLEEVFMKVGADTLLKVGSNSVENLGSDSKSEFENSSQIKLGIDVNVTYQGYKLYMNHVKAMFKKRFLITLRSWTFVLVQMLIPILLLTFAIISGRNSAVNDLPNLRISLDPYNKPITVLASNNSENIYYKTAKKMLEDNKKLVDDFGKKDVIKEMLAITTEQESKVRLNYIIGTSFEEDKMIAWYNNNPYHSPPLALNFLMNVILKADKPNYEINVNNHPLPYTFKSKLQLLQQGNNIGFQLAVNIGFCMAFISAFYILFYVRERICKVKHLQIVSGVNMIIFWLVSFLWDILTFTVTIICLIVTLVCFQEDGFKSGGDIGRLIFIFIYFGFSMLPLTYMMSFIFKQPSSGFIRVILFTTVCGTFAFMIVEILSFDAFNLTHVAKALDWIFLLVPHYSLSASIRNVNMEYVRYTNCEKYLEACALIDKCDDLKECQDNKENYYKWEKPGILRNILFSFGIGIVLIAALFLKEYKIFSKIVYQFQNKNKRNIEPTDGLDSDVQLENEKIRSMPMQTIKNNTIVLKDVTKYYNKFLAVNGICLGVNQYECFGLLGVNGAGKTSTFRMITGDARISYGDVYVNGLNLKTDAKEVNKVIGYCPQFDALFDDLTAKETIEIFCLLRGFSKKECSYFAERLSKDFDFSQHLNKQVKQMSGGNKRKLSTAVALIGNPPILYLDEPTTGMDPATKRYLWNVLCKVRDSGKCLILTSHSMEECEALCTRLAIMVNGMFKCLGSTQHLKNKFSKGYTLTIKLLKTNGPAETTEIETFVQENFPNSVLREKHQELITFYLPDTSLSWSTMFGIMERAKTSLNIEDYSLGQSSLEEVFLTFTKTQTSK